jgi:hypothetical protein
MSWSLARRTVDDDPNVVAFVGTSRMQLAYSPQAFAEAAPHLRGVQLAINGVPALRILEDLAADEHFRGVAVVDMDEWDIAWGDPNRSAEPYVERAHALWRAPGALANRVLAGYAQERVALLAIGGHAFVTGFVRGRWPAPTWVASARDRSAGADWDLVTPANRAAKAKKRLTNFDTPAMAADAWVTRALAIEPVVERIRARGGKVVIVRLPISGRLAELFDQHYPRRLYWDAFAARASIPVLHFRDQPGMRDLTCPDEMHLDQRDQPAFTRALVSALRERGVLPRD